ncbi:formylglycine-generating enzyme family protein [Leptolyngbya sp. FACHB-1624]|nr:formylglycine-generating enzyme family protein [Leptolyngbya sp. FACHB-1624]
MDRNTIAKIRRRTEPVRLNTLQKLFSHLGLELEESDYEYYTNDLIAGVAVLRQMKGIPHLVIHRHLAQAWQFIEMLNEAEVVLEMVSIPGGSFLMGSPEDELERFSSESPQNSVTVDSFFIGKYPITQAQWRIVAEFEQVNRSLDSDPSRFKGDDRPVEKVSWHDAVEFCDRLSRFTGKAYRLPTEAEWEYACRAGTHTPFHFGETITTDLANYRGTDNKEFGRSGSYGDGPTGIYREETIPVGSLGVANNFGLYDMHGNVWEWCQDHWHGNYEGAPPDGSAWIDLNADEDAARVLRGGSWLDDPWYCRSATRFNYDAGIRYSYVGFRVVCSAPRTL